MYVKEENCIIGNCFCLGFLECRIWDSKFILEVGVREEEEYRKERLLIKCIIEFVFVDNEGLVLIVFFRKWFKFFLELLV